MSLITVTVYLQALGGKLLGPNAWNPNYNSISVVMNVGGTPFNLNYNASSSIDDGNITPLVSGRTPNLLPIITPDNTNSGQVDYLATDSNSVCGTLPSFLVTTMTPATITATIPYPNMDTPMTITQQVVLSPTQSTYTYTLIVPGLLLEQDTASSPSQVAVFVKMMCGCPVTVNTFKSFRAPEDFVVTAYATYGPAGTVAYPMHFDPAANNSSFIATMVDPSYTSIYFTAQQRSTGNYGYLLVSGS
ncbi:MAG: hypothetical protein J7623_28185 [Chitinophaga sp.]|uniref:hypothetical protein n=1 Tax=Chitinophaga sp. TaxID=1869181 RepID=UPI001B14B0CE|nr:hypothetical protein [Chitinophaga sp.]MBO9732555.1 hypothetical protein [Chitinophaga sp.]